MPTVDSLIERYGDRVRFVFRDYPLPFHVNARAAAEAALEARAQRGDSGYFAMHDLLFENQTDLSRPALERFTSALGLDMVRFGRALDTHVHEASIGAASGSRCLPAGTSALCAERFTHVVAMAFSLKSG